MAVFTLNKHNFNEEALQSERTVLVDFWAPWCGPCRMVSPIVDEIAEESEEIKVGKINVDEEPELALRYNVMSIPTLLVIQDGEVVKSSVGMKSKQAILDLLGE